MQSNTGFFACIAKENCYHKDDISVNDILDRILIVANAEEKKDGYILDVTSNGGERLVFQHQVIMYIVQLKMDMLWMVEHLWQHRW